MNYRKKDVIVGLILIAFLLGGFYLYKTLKNPKALPTPTPSANMTEIQGLFNYVIPEDLESIELKDVSGSNARGLATRKFEDGLYSHTVLADLPDPETGEFYEGWLTMDTKFISTGKLTVAKGGFLLEFSSTTDYSEYDGVVITKEKLNDGTPEMHILEGSF